MTALAISIRGALRRPLTEEAGTLELAVPSFGDVESAALVVVVLPTEAAATRGLCAGRPASPSRPHPAANATLASAKTMIPRRRRVTYLMTWRSCTSQTSSTLNRQDAEDGVEYERPMTSDVSLVGHGVRLRIETGTELGRSPDGGGSLVVAHFDRGTVRNALVSVREADTTIVGGADGDLAGLSLEPVATAREAWRIEGSGFSCTWPDGTKLRVLPEGVASWEFELADEGEGLVFLRGPLRGAQVPAPPDLVAPDQEVVASDMTAAAMWIELRYEHEGQAWRQRHQYAVPAAETVVLVTAQALEGTEKPLFRAAAEVAASVRIGGSRVPSAAAS